ncbi:hypothetical protein HDU96_001888, partial [Phlyctochytrium bullatum]
MPTSPPSSISTSNRMLSLPLDLLRHLLLHLHPQDLLKMPLLSRSSHALLAPLTHDPYFARSHLVRLSEATRETIHWHLLPPAYHAALVSLTGPTTHTLRTLAPWFRGSFASADHLPTPSPHRVTDAILLASTLHPRIDTATDDSAALRWTLLADNPAAFCALAAHHDLDRDDLLDLTHTACRLGAANVLPDLLRRLTETPTTPLDLQTDTLATSLAACLTECVARGHAVCARHLLNHHPASAPSPYHLVMAARRGHAHVVRLLLPLLPPQAPAAFDAKALRVAAAAGHDDVVAVLLEAVKPVPATHLARCLRSAAEHGHAGVVKQLLGVEGEPVPTREPLVAAAANGHAQVVGLLLATPPLRSEDAAAAVAAAAAGGHAEVVEMLLGAWRGAAGAKRRARRAGLVRAAAGGHTKVVEALVGE